MKARMATFAVALCAVTLGTAATAEAGTTGTVTVSDSTLDFGGYTGQAGDASATITVTATTGVDFQIELDGGLNPDIGGVRKMSGVGGGDDLGYHLYKDSIHSQPWAIGEAVSFTGTGSPQQVTVYGRIPADQTVSADTYQDAVTISASIDGGDADNATLSVGSHVVNGATVSDSTLDFGGYMGLASDASAAITVTAPNGVDFQVELDAGLNADATTRRMSGIGGDDLGYHLYTDSIHSQPWALGEAVSFTGTGSPQVINVYGRIPADQSVSAGSYQDAVTISASTDVGGAETATLNVGADVSSGLTVGDSTLDFGGYTGAATDVSSTITVTAADGVDFAIELGPGLNADATTRRMSRSGGADNLGYHLYQDSARTQPWDLGEAVSFTGTGSPQDVTVYGRIPAGQPASVGSYQDTVTISASTIVGGGDSATLSVSAEVEADTDEDGVPDGSDNCPSVANPSQSDHDHDGIGDACDTNTDIDGDGLGDPGYPANTSLTDNCYRIPNPSQADTDGDGLGNDCDPIGNEAGGNPDTDGDGLADPIDNCIEIPNANQVDTDDDTVGDVCDGSTSITDFDGDGKPNNDDNCVLFPNPGQVDTDADGRGNICDVCPTGAGSLDGDADGVYDACDVCPGDQSSSPDTDADGVGDECAVAPDNCVNVANPGQVDADADGIGDACDVCPNDPTNTGDEPPPPTCQGEEATIEAEPGVPVLGTDGDDVIVGTDGQDEIDAGGGADLVCALSEDDEVRGSGGRDELYGGGGADLVTGRDGADLLFGEDGDDEVRGGKATDDLDGGTDNDTCQGGHGTDFATATCELLRGVP